MRLEQKLPIIIENGESIPEELAPSEEGGDSEMLTAIKIMLGVETEQDTAPTTGAKKAKKKLSPLLASAMSFRAQMDELLEGMENDA